MPTPITHQQYSNQEIVYLRREVAVLKEAIIAIARDPEGAYRASFIRKIMKRKQEPANLRFTTPSAFLDHVRGTTK